MCGFTSGTGRTGHPHVKKNASRHRLSTLHNNDLKMDHRAKCKM